MLYPATHLKFTRGLFPFIDPRLIKSVDHQIDNPTMWQHYLNTMQNTRYRNNGFMKNPYDIFNLTGGGHRAYNHDVLTGSLVGMVQARKMGLPPMQGIVSAFSHYATDALSNKMVQHLGVEGRNIFEAVMSMNAKKQQAMMPRQYKSYRTNRRNPYFSYIQW